MATIVAPNPVSAKYAEVILHSYGIGDERLNIVSSVRDASGDKCKNRITLGDCTEKSPIPLDPVGQSGSSTQQYLTAIIVLGNRPLDDSTPTVDMVTRVLAAIQYARTLPEPAFVLTGAPTVGIISEAKMMALMALSRGIARNRLILEEQSWTTGRNAAFTAPIVARLGVKNVFIVSKKTHLEFAMPEFFKYDVFKEARPLESPEVHNQSIQQMLEYLKLHSNPEVRSRLDALKNNSHGVD